MPSRRLHLTGLSAALVVATAIMLWTPARARACAACSCGTAAPIAPGLDVPFSGRLRTALFLDAASVEDEHNVVLASQARLGVWWAPVGDLVLDAALPVGARARFDRHDGDENGHALHLADATVGARFILFRDRTFAPRHIGSLRVAMTTPTGPELVVGDASAKAAPVLAPELQPGRGAWIPRLELSWLALPTRAVQLLATLGGEASMSSSRALAPAPQADASFVVQWTPTPPGGARAGVRLGASARVQGEERRGALPAPAGQRASVLALAGVVVEPTTDVLVVLDAGVPLVSEPFGGGLAHDRALASVSLIWDVPPLAW